MKELQYPVRPGRYRHFKGNEYQVLGVARHSETEEEMVVYRALYGEGGLWAVSYTHLPGGAGQCVLQLGDHARDLVEGLRVLVGVA